MNNPVKTAIIGCGDIAGGYDERKAGDGIFTHAGAYASLPGVEIDAVFDINSDRLDDFCAYWPVRKKCSSLNNLLKGSYDIISVCTPDDTHEEIIKRILNAGCTRFIWTEKPLTTTVQGAEEIVKRAVKASAGLWLTNQRQWEPAHLKISAMIKEKAFGELVYCSIYYVKGITHIGCTAINTMRLLCGEIEWVRAFLPYEEGSYGDDHSLRGILGFTNGVTGSIIGCDRKKYTYSVFEIDIMCTLGRVRILENGDIINVYKVKEYSHYSGFGELVLTDSLNADLKWSMNRGLEMLLEFLRDHETPVSSACEGVRDLKVVEALKLSAKMNGTEVSLHHAIT